jgi:hypothetical protein
MNYSLDGSINKFSKIINKKVTISSSLQDFKIRMHILRFMTLIFNKISLILLYCYFIKLLGNTIDLFFEKSRKRVEMFVQITKLLASDVKSVLVLKKNS